MSKEPQKLGAQPVRTPGPGRDARPVSRPARLATVIGNRAMQRLAAGAAPAGLAGRTRILQRDTPKSDATDPKTGWWVKFEGSHSALGDWLPLGDFSLDKGTEADEVTGFVDILLASPKGLKLGAAFDTSEHLTLLIEQRSPDSKPIRQPPQQVVITSLEIKTTMDVEERGGVKRTSNPRTRIRVGLRYLGTPTVSH